MCTNNVPPVLQMFTGGSAVKSFPPVKIENHHGTCTPIFDPCCCFGGLYGGLYGIGPQSWMAADTVMASDIHGSMKFSDIIKNGLKGFTNNFFAGSWGSAQQIGYTAMPSLAAGFLGGVGNIVKNTGSIFSNV